MTSVLLCPPVYLLKVNSEDPSASLTLSIFCLNYFFIPAYGTLAVVCFFAAAGELSEKPPKTGYMFELLLFNFIPVVPTIMTFNFSPPLPTGLSPVFLYRMILLMALLVSSCRKIKAANSGGKH